MPHLGSGVYLAPTCVASERQREGVEQVTATSMARGGLFPWVGVWVSEKGHVGWLDSPRSLRNSLKTQKEQNGRSQSQAKKVTVQVRWP